MGFSIPVLQGVSRGPVLAGPRLRSYHLQRSDRQRVHPICRRFPADSRDVAQLVCWRNVRVEHRAVLATAVASPRPGVSFRESPEDGEMGISEPFSYVSDVMTEVGLKATTPDASLESVVPLLESVSGLPVVDQENKVVGVITRKDIIRLKETGSNLQGPVFKYMSQPPVTVKGHAHVGEAAAVMLARKIHRLPVVDSDSRLIGIVSRTDIMMPLLHPRSDLYKWAAGEMQENPPLSEQLEEVEAKQAEPTWQVKYLYDGDCPVCASVKAFLTQADGGRGRIMFVDISSGMYEASDHAGVEYEEAMEDIHAIKRDGTIVTGYPALELLYDVVGLGWVMRIASIPGLNWLVQKLYDSVSDNRHALGSMMKPLAAANVAMSVKKMEEDGGTSTCGKEKEECEAPDW